MNTFVVYNEDGTIQSCADWKFPNSVEVAFEVVRAWDGKLYKAGEEPKAPKLYEEPEPIVISSNTITYSDADLLYKASVAGEKTAAWLIEKLDL